jgi:hypothetical protein
LNEIDEAELRRHAEEQAALFRIGMDDDDDSSGPAAVAGNSELDG